MRIAMVLAVLAVAGCASEKLAQSPPKQVDLSGHWKLNAADSDDPLRLMQSQLANATAGAGPGGQTGSTGRGNRRGQGGDFGPGPVGPVMPSVTTLDEALRWPGKDLTLKQSGGIVTFVSDGTDRVCRPTAAGMTIRTSRPAMTREVAMHPRTVGGMCRRPVWLGSGDAGGEFRARPTMSARRSSNASACPMTVSG